MDVFSPLEYALKLTKIGFSDENHEDAEGRKIGLVRSIPVDAVLANAWRPKSLALCRRQLAEGTRPPRIKVVGMRRQGGPTLYCVSDGMHRTVAAKEAGKKTIRAEVEGWYDCEPTRFILHRGAVWDTEPDTPFGRAAYRCVAHIKNMPQGTDKALADLGVRVVPDDQSAFA